MCSNNTHIKLHQNLTWADELGHDIFIGLTKGRFEGDSHTNVTVLLISVHFPTNQVSAVVALTNKAILSKQLWATRR